MPGKSFLNNPTLKAIKKWEKLYLRTRKDIPSREKLQEMFDEALSQFGMRSRKLVFFRSLELALSMQEFEMRANWLSLLDAYVKWLHICPLVKTKIKNYGTANNRLTPSSLGMGNNIVPELLINSELKGYQELFTKVKPFLLFLSNIWCIRSPDDKTAVVLLPPRYIRVNENNQLHSEKGPAIYFTKDDNEYYLNGIKVPAFVVEEPESSKNLCQLYFTERNADIRREIIRKIGVSKVFQHADAKVIESRDGYELLETHVLGNRRIYLKMTNPSIRTIHIEGVPPSISTVEEALNFRNGTHKRPENLT